jgi:hypothetical protein
LEWQFPHARTKICPGSAFDESRSPRFLGSLAAGCSVPTCPTIRAKATNPAIDFSVLMTEVCPYLERLKLVAIVRPGGRTSSFDSLEALTLRDLPKASLTNRLIVFTT